MTASNFNLRGLSTRVASLLKKEAKRLNTSVNALILSLIERGLGVSGERARPVYHDLDHLAGTWTPADLKEFKENARFFEQVDKDLWK